MITTFLRPLKACVQGSRNFRRIYKLPQTFGRQNWWHAHRWHRNIMRHFTRCSYPRWLETPDVYTPGLVWWRKRYFVAACHGDRNIANPNFWNIVFRAWSKAVEMQNSVFDQQKYFPSIHTNFPVFFLFKLVLPLTCPLWQHRPQRYDPPKRKIFQTTKFTSTLFVPWCTSYASKSAESNKGSK